MEDVETRLSPRVVEVEPEAASYHKIAFHRLGRTRRDDAVAGPAKLAKFQHTPGSKAYVGRAETMALLRPSRGRAPSKRSNMGSRRYAELFPRFALALDGGVEHCYFYYTTSVVCEAPQPIVVISRYRGGT